MQGKVRQTPLKAEITSANESDNPTLFKLRRSHASNADDLPGYCCILAQLCGWRESR